MMELWEGSFSVISGNMSLSKIFAAGHSRDTGRYDLDSLRSLPGLERGITVEHFQIDGIAHVAVDRLFKT